MNNIMKYGIIYNNLAIIVELENKSIEIINQKNEYYLIRDWKNKINSEFVAKNCLIVSKNDFINNLKYFDNQLSTIQKIIWDFVLYNLNYQTELPFYPKVSVILCSYNSIKTINYAIKSIIIQKYKNIELIVIDDFSNDGTYEKILELKEKYNNKISNFEVYRNSSNNGVYFSRNFGIKKSTGEIIAMQDADDISDKNRLTISVYELLTHNVDFVLSNSTKISNIGKLSSISVAMATIVIKKNFYNKYGYYDEETRHSGDLEIIDRAYYMKYGKYEMDNFWFWLNYTSYLEGFYYHIYINLYYIGENENSITKINKLNERMNYLLNRRKKLKNKI